MADDERSAPDQGLRPERWMNYVHFGADYGYSAVSVRLDIFPVANRFWHEGYMDTNLIGGRGLCNVVGYRTPSRIRTGRVRYTICAQTKFYSMSY